MVVHPSAKTGTIHGTLGPLLHPNQKSPDENIRLPTQLTYKRASGLGFPLFRLAARE